MFGKKKLNPRASVQWKKMSLEKVMGKVKICFDSYEKENSLFTIHDRRS